MRPISFIFIIALLAIGSTSCKKKKSAPLTCACGTEIIDRFHFVNWDNIPDTADLYIYNNGNNFTNPVTAYTGNWLHGDGYTEGLNFFLGDDSAKEFKLVLRQHHKVYKLKSYTHGNDRGDCSVLNDSIRCFNHFSFIINDSLVEVPMQIVNYNNENAYILQLHL